MIEALTIFFGSLFGVFIGLIVLVAVIIGALNMVGFFVHWVDSGFNWFVERMVDKGGERWRDGATVIAVFAVLSMFVATMATVGWGIS